MADFDVFNGDADGICALVQLRQVEPRDSELVTGVKRNIALLSQVQAVKGDRVTVLDVSMAKNCSDLDRILKSGATVFYVDHHDAGEVPASSSLISLINESPNVSTSLLVNQYLRGARLAWGAVGTFGDNLKHTAQGMLKGSNVKSEQVEMLNNLGIYMNYNGYGADLSDLHFPPAELYNLVYEYENPVDFISDSKQHFEKLESGYHQDFSSVQALSPLRVNNSNAVYLLPDTPWARRVSGVFSNDLTNRYPDRAHAVLTEKSNGGYLVSVRAPLSNKQGASALCSQFPTGGGREAAAGINNLSAEQLSEFIDKFEQTYQSC
ncbi:MAG: DHH family phosphoesterase [Porticoccaceae bacterium]|nr:DHH family phosphoesterase [Porticoccaceae bacterium]